jgi:hypothetical protein
VATVQEKNELFEALKAQPEIYDIIISGYGGEIVVGSIDADQYQYWKDRDDLEDHCHDWDNEMVVPESAVIVSNGSWHDQDDLAHWTGCEFSPENWITVYRRRDNATVLECRLDYDELEAAGVDTEGFAHEEFYTEFDSSAQHAFMAQSVEKGTFYTGEIETSGKFDPLKLSLSMIDVEGWQLINGVSYQSKIVDDTGGYSTTGKSLDFRIFKVEK